MVSPPTRDELQQIWDREAPTFDDEPDHGLRDPRIRDAWRNKLRDWLPSGSPENQTVLDVGCGTGSLSILMASLGYAVTGVDISPAMLAQAAAKAAADGWQIPFHVGDAAHLPPTLGPFDAVVCRHLLWSFPEPATVLARWVGHLNPEGHLVLIEGFWHTGAGLRAAETIAALQPFVPRITVENLSDQPMLWGKTVTDERYAVTGVLGTRTAPPLISPLGIQEGIQ